jgi:hypothetical protein
MDKVQTTRNATQYLVQKKICLSKERFLNEHSIIMFINYTHDFFDDGNGKSHVISKKENLVSLSKSNSTGKC